jgi:SAM-dependent methyltransferase
VIHAGRFADHLSEAKLPRGCRVFAGEIEPSKLAAELDDASALVVFDPASFPLESLEGRTDVPLAVVTDSSQEVPFFERLGFFDLVAAPDSATGRNPREKRSRFEGRRVDSDGEDHSRLAARLCELLRETPNLRAQKAAHRVREKVLKRCLDAVERGEEPLDVLEVGVEDGRWAASFDPATTKYSGLGKKEEELRAARSRFPERRFDLLAPRFSHPDESFDFVFSVDLFQSEPPHARTKLLSEMWRVARPGGRLVSVEDFVFEKPEERKPPPMTAPGFARSAMEATNNRVTLDHVESFRYPGEDMIRGGVISLRKLGPAKSRQTT